MEKDNNIEHEEVTVQSEDTEEVKETSREDGEDVQETASPNELMFAKAQSGDGSPPKKSSGKKRVLLISCAAVILVLAITFGVLAFSGALGNFIESRLMSPEDQLCAVLKREAEAAIKEYQASQNATRIEQPLQRTGRAEVRADEQFLQLLNSLNPTDLDLSVLGTLTDLGFYYGVRADDETVTASLNLAEDGSSLGATAYYDAADGTGYLSIPLLSDALLSAQADIDLSFLRTEVKELTEDDVQALVELSEEIIDHVSCRIGTVERVRETVEGEEKVKCDRLSFTVDRDCASDIMADVADTLGEEKYSQRLGDILSEGGYDTLIDMLNSPEEVLSEDFTLTVDLWISDGETVGIKFSEKTSDTGFYRMEPTNVIEFSAELMGIPVTVGGEVKDGNGVFTVRSLMGVRVGKIITEGFSCESGAFNGTVTATLSDELVTLGATLGDGYLGGKLSALGDLGGYAVIIDLSGDEAVSKMTVTVKNSEKELLYLYLDGTSEAEVEAFDPEGCEVYTLDEFAEWRDTVKVSGSLLKAILNGPEFILQVIPENYRGILDGAVDILPDSVLDFVADGVLDGYIDPILDRVQEFITAKGE